METTYKNDAAAIDGLASDFQRLKQEIGKKIIGQEQVVEAVIISLFSNGHSLLVGVPGLAKTLLVSTISEVLDLDFKRIQFTPDLMPSDIMGSEVLGDDRQFKFNKGPVFANIVLADEINRTPPKTQAQVFFFTYEVDAPSVSRVLPETPGEAQTQLRVQEMSADLR